MDTTYIAVGRALLATQILETALVPIYELYRVSTEPDRLAKTQGYLSAGAFKVPTSTIVKMLSDKGSIAADLETRIKAYIDNRHLLVHRWTQEHGVPATEKDFLLLAMLALKVEMEARELSRILARYVVKHSGPDWAAANLDDYKLKMAGIFLEAHTDV